MGIFSWFRKEKPVTDQLSTSAGKSIFTGGASTSGIFVSKATAMQNPAVFACVRVIAEGVASLPIHVYRHEDNGAKVVRDHHLFPLLHTAPNTEMTSFVFRETLMHHLLIYGNAYAQIVRDGAGRVTALYPLLPSKIDVNRNENGRIYYTYWRNTDEARPHEKTGAVTFRRDEVLHIPAISYDGIVGLSAVDLARNAIGMAVATEEYGAAFFANGANPSGVLEHTGTLKEPGKIRDAWMTIHGGVKNAGKTAVLEDGLKYSAISIPPDQAQFLETRKFQLNEIARIFRIPPHMIGDLEKSSYSNIIQQSLEFVMYTLEPWIIKWEQSMNQALIPPSEQSRYYVKFNLDGLLRGDFETRMKGYSIGIQNGFMSSNDIRRLENFNLIPANEGGDDYIVNGNMVRLRDVGAAYKVKNEQLEGYHAEVLELLRQQRKPYPLSDRSDSGRNVVG
jgi:HK97 family phage portal protein